MLVGFLFLPYLARAMSILDYGTYAQTLMIVSLLAGLMAFGLSKVIFSFLAKPELSQPTTLGSNLLIAALCGTMAAFLAFITSSWLASQFNNDAVEILII